MQVYFSQFRKTPFGMLRLDPQDAGPGYRNVIGIPGGVHSPLFRVLQVSGYTSQAHLMVGLASCCHCSGSAPAAPWHSPNQAPCRTPGSCCPVHELHVL